MAVPDSRVGSTIQGRYQLVRLLGDGGMGAVYKAADSVLRRFVAVKLLHPAASQNPSAVDRFVREARAAASIGHPNIIEILDFGTMDDGRPYLVMEYLRGRSLSHAIAHEKPFSIERACSIATHSLSGLAAAHDRGILHRDLKPANLMLISQLGDRDFVKLCDFGFATLLSPKEAVTDGKSLTPARTLVGTPAYAAPERLRGDDRPDPRMDVYSIGVVLYEMLAGRRPFDAPTFAELSLKVKTQEPPPLATFRPDIPESLDRVLRRALAKQRDDRFPSATEFAAALVPYGGRRVATVDDSPSDSFTMDILRLRARETQHKLRISQVGLEASPLRVSVPSSAGAQKKTEPSSDIPVEVEVSLEEDEIVSTNDLDLAVLQPITLSDGNAESSDARKALRSKPPGPRRSVPPASSGNQVRGALVLALMKFIARRFSARALKDVLAAIPPPYQPIFRNGVSEDDWIPLDAFAAMQSALDTKYGRDDLQLFVQCGRGAAEAVVSELRGRLALPASPEVVLVELPTVFASSLHGIGARVRGVGRGYGSIELVDASSHELTTCISMLGFMERLFTETAASEIEVNSVSCRALGDAACVFDLSWLA